MGDKKINVGIELLPCSRDNNGNPIVPLELINIKNKVKYIKEKTEQLLQLNKSTVNEREIEIQIIKIKDYLVRVMNAIVSFKNQYKERLNNGYLKERVEKEYDCTQEEWERNFTYSDEFDIENSIKNHLKYLENEIKVKYPTFFSRYFKKGYRTSKNYISTTKRNIEVIALFSNTCLRLLTNIENVIKDLRQDKQIVKSKKESSFIEPSKDSITTYLSRLHTALKLYNDNAEVAESIRKTINSLKDFSSVIKSDFGSSLFIKKAISFSSLKKAEKIFLMGKEEWDDFIENAVKIDYGEFLDKLVNVFGNILEYSKEENMGEEAIDAIKQDIANINSSKNMPSIIRENIDKIESGVKIEIDRYIPPEVRREVWRRDQGRCVQCGSQLNLEFDHIIPISKGGSITARNIQLLCERCNREKTNKI